MKFLISLSVVLFVSKAFSQNRNDSTKTLYTFSYNLVPQKDSSFLYKTNKPLQNDSTIIKGKLIDDITNEAVIFATISFASKKDRINLSAISTVDGEFRLAIPNHNLKRKITIKILGLGVDSKMITYKRKQFPLPYQTIKLKRNVTILN